MRRLFLVLVAAVAVAVSGCSYQTAGAPKGDLTLYATFEDVQGLLPGHSVQMSDIKIGSVIEVELVDGYKAKVTLSIEDDIQVPKGTRAEIKMTSLLGENFVDLQMPPGTSMAQGPYLGDGGSITDTRVQPAFEDVVGQAGPLIQALAGDDLAAVVDAGATALDGNGKELGATIAKSGDLVKLFADQRRALGASIDQFAKLGRSLAKREDVLAEAPEQLQRTTDLLNKNKKKMLHAVDELTKAAEQLNNKVLVGRIARFRGLLQDIDPILQELGTSRKRLTGLVNSLVSFSKEIPLATYDGQLLLSALVDIKWPDGTSVIPGITDDPAGGNPEAAKSPKLPKDLMSALPGLEKILEPRPMRRFALDRIKINLLVFATLAVVMVVWAFNNVVKLDFIDRPYHISVEFESSPGLQPGFEVDYLGVRIGKIDSVELVGDKVVVKLDIERGIEIPEGVTAAGARKSAVGEPVVELTPGKDPANAPSLEPGAVIPVSKTSTPPEYSDLFSSVIDTLKAIDPQDAKVLTSELADGWEGRENSLRQIINGGDQLTGTLAANSELLDGLTKDLARITDVLNKNRGHLGAGVDNLAALTGALAQVKTEIGALRDQGPELLSTVNQLMEKTGPDFECTIDSLGNWGLSKHNPQVLSDLGAILAKAPELGKVLNQIIGRANGKPVLKVGFMLTLNTPSALEYEHPLPQPAVNKVPTCPGDRLPAETEQATYPGKAPGDTIPTHDPSIGREEELRAQQAAATEDTGGPPPWLVYTPPVIALLVLIRVMAGSVPVVSRLSRLRRRDED